MQHHEPMGNKNFKLSNITNQLNKNVLVKEVHIQDPINMSDKHFLTVHRFDIFQSS